MAKYPKARVVPFSSVVGSSVTLHDPETERVIGQLGILNVGGDTPADWKARSIAFAEDIAKRINCHDELVEALEAIRDAGLGGYLTPELCADVVTEALVKAKGGAL